MKSPLFACLAALALSAGDATGDPLPPSLPISNLQTMVNWVVTNRPVNVTIGLRFIDTNGSNQFPYVFTFGSISFNSFASFETCIQTNCWNIYTTDVVGDAEADSPIGLYVSVTLPNPYIPGYLLNSGLVIQTNIGTYGNITSNSFTNFTAAAYNNLRPSVLVPNLSLFSVVSTNPAYSYTWTPSNQTQTTGFPPEYTTSGAVVMNAWYGYGTNDVRLTVAVPGQTNVYTGFGALLANPAGTVSRSNLVVTLTPGADVAVRTATNLQTPLGSWTTVTNLSWSLNTNTAAIAIPPGKTAGFYGMSNVILGQ